MDAATRRIVQHYAQKDAWNMFTTLFPDEVELEETLDTALTIEGSPIGVAAWLLENLADKAVHDAAVESVKQVKRQKDGSEELEFFQAQSVHAAAAARYRERAAQLRNQLRVAAAAAANPAPILESWGVG